MSDYDDDYVWGERINRQAARQLIERHQQEYDELTGAAAQARADQLQREITDALREIKHLRSMNPDGINAPALTETANGLVAINDELRVTVKSLTRRANRLAKENTKLRDMLAESEPKEEA